MLSAESLIIKKFFAYHTKTNHTATDYREIRFNCSYWKNQLEFTRKTSYSPLWVTTGKKYLIDNFFPEKKSIIMLNTAMLDLLKTVPKKSLFIEICPRVFKIEIANEN